METTFPRVTIPGVDRAAADKLAADMDATRRLRRMMAGALVRAGKHVYRQTVPAKVRRARRKTDKAARLARKAHR